MNDAVKLCEDCPPVGYPTDETRCTPCPRRSPIAQGELGMPSGRVSSSDEHSAWLLIETAPDTPATEAEPWGKSIRVLVYSPQLGTCAGSLHRWPGHPATVNVASFHGDAVEHWGVTHWQPDLAPPSETLPIAAPAVRAPASHTPD